MGEFFILPLLYKQAEKQNKTKRKLFFRLEGVPIHWMYLIPLDGKDFT